MTLTLLDLYNSAATQEWAMYDNDAVSDSEFEESLVMAINKSIIQIYSSYNFPFRERTHVIITIPRIGAYDMPNGLIKTDINGKPLVKYNSVLLNKTENLNLSNKVSGTPMEFCIKNDRIIFSPIPSEKGLVTIDYYTLTIGENIEGEEIYSLKNDTDILTVPLCLEELMKEAVITRAMLNSIASETDENYFAYKKQADKAYRLLIKYSKGVDQDKAIKF